MKLKFEWCDEHDEPLIIRMSPNQLDVNNQVVVDLNPMIIIRSDDNLTNTAKDYMTKYIESKITRLHITILSDDD